jgi:hypothetical protein
MGKITTVGIDLAKQVFSIHAVDDEGHVVLRKRVGRARLLPTLAQLPPCLVGMESCSGAHEWARQIQSLGHTVRIMAARLCLGCLGDTLLNGVWIREISHFHHGAPNKIVPFGHHCHK